MSIIFAALVSFISLYLLIRHLGPRGMRRVVGYIGWVDLLLHGTILWMFLGTSTLGLLQAEACGILFSLYLRGYRHFNGFERYRSGRGWVRHAGVLT